MKALKALSAVMIIVFIILCISDISFAVSQAILRCINIIIPSLFIIMVASRYIVTKNLMSPIAKLLKPLCVLTGMNTDLLTVFILSNIGGYPIGASMLSQMAKKGEISENDAAIAASYCFGSGPAFVVGAVGLCVYESSQIGYLMFASCVIANLAACIIYNRVFRTELHCEYRFNDHNGTYTVSDAIIDSGKSLFTMCAVIVAFSLANVALEKLTAVLGYDMTLIAPLVEVTNSTSQSFARLSLAHLVTAYISFGGICVWMQNAALAGKSFSILRALVLRIPIALLSGGIFKALYSRFAESSLPANADFNGFVVNIDNFLPSICLIIMIFLLINKKRLAFLKNV